MARRKGFKKVYVLYSEFYKRIMLDKNGEMYIYQDFTKAKKGAGKLQAGSFKARNIGLIIVECKLNETGHVTYRRSPRSLKRDKFNKNTA